MTNLKTTDLSLIPNIVRFSVGLDRMLDEVTRNAETSSFSGYPPYNIVATDENRYTIEIAVAGFGQEDLDIQVDQNQLVIEGNIEEKEERKYLHKGISARRFSKKFTLADHVQVQSAKVKNGLLIVELERVIPEELKPRRIPIAFSE